MITLDQIWITSVTYLFLTLFVIVFLLFKRKKHFVRKNIFIKNESEILLNYFLLMLILLISHSLLKIKDIDNALLIFFVLIMFVLIKFMKCKN